MVHQDKGLHPHEPTINTTILNSAVKAVHSWLNYDVKMSKSFMKAICQSSIPQNVPFITKGNLVMVNDARVIIPVCSFLNVGPSLLRKCWRTPEEQLKAATLPFRNTFRFFSALSMEEETLFTWGRRNTSVSYIWCTWNRLFFLINKMINCNLLTEHHLRTESETWEATGLLTGSYISVSHCSDFAMLGFATVFTLRGGGGGWKGEFTDKTVP